MEINIWLKVYTEIWWTWTLLISPVPKVIEVNLKFCRTKQQSITRSPRNLQSFLFFGLHDFFQCAYHSVKIWFSTTAGTAKSFQSCPTLCDPIDSCPPGSPVPGILQARTLEWVAISFSNAWKWKLSQSCPTLSDPMDCSPPGSSVHGIFQARVLEWGAI